MINHKAVYTFIIGDYDDLKTPTVFTKGWDYICFTDNPNLHSDFWDIRLSNKNELGFELDNKKFAMAHMILFHKYLSQYDISLSIGGQILINCNLDTFLNENWTDSDDMLITKHPKRDCIYDEAEVCKKIKKDKAELIDEHMARYLAEGYPKNNGLYATGIIARRHDRKKVVDMCELWYHEYIKGSKRDQLSLNYAIWKSEPISISEMSWYEAFVANNSYFKIENHNSNRSTTQKIITAQDKYIFKDKIHFDSAFQKSQNNNTSKNMKLYNNSIFSDPQFIDRPFAWIEHIPFAFFLIETLKPKTFVELGSHAGNSYFSFCQTVNNLKLNTKCYAIDTWKGDEHATFYSEDVFNRVKTINKDYFNHFSVLMRMTFDEGLNYFSNNSVDLLHIDGLHTYEAVSHDFKSWLPKMSDKGIIILHDTNVKRSSFGVWKLFEELEKEYPAFQFIHGYGLGVICIGKNVDKQFIEFVKDAQYSTEIQNLFATLGNRLLIRAEKREIELKLKDLQYKLSNQNKLIEDSEFQKIQNRELRKEIENKEEDLILKTKKIIESEMLLKSTYNRLDNLKNDLVQKQKQINELYTHIKKVEMSSSWRITSPLRYITRKLVVTKQFLKILVKIIFYALTFKRKKLIHKLKQLKSIFAIRNSKLFDFTYYYKKYPDVRESKLNGIIHYVEKGATEGRNPQEDFNTSFYINQYPDVLLSGMNPLVHFLKIGVNEDRKTHPVNNKKINFKVKQTRIVTKLKSLTKRVYNKLIIGPSRQLFIYIFHRKEWIMVSSDILNNKEKAIKKYPIINEIEYKLNNILKFEINYSEKLDYTIVARFIKDYLKINYSIKKLLNELSFVEPKANKEFEVRQINYPESNKQLKILYVSAMFPSIGHGGGLRLFDILTHLSKNHEVDLFSCYIEDLDKASFEILKSRINNIKLSKKDYGIINLNEIQAWLNQSGKYENYYDIIHFEYPGSVNSINSLKWYGKKIGFTYMECVSKRTAIDIVNSINDIEKTPSLIQELIENLRLEILATKNSDFTIAVSEEDAEFVNNFAEHTPFIIPTCVSDSFFSKAKELKGIVSEEFDAAFVGYFDHKPNIEAIEWYYNEVHNKIIKQIPDYKLVIIGRGDASKLIKLCEGDESIIFTGEVDDIAEYVLKAKICISPLVSGAGIRGKINQYSILERPSVSTTIGLCGTPYVNGDSVLQADSPDDFSEAILKLLTDNNLYNKLVRNGKKVAENNFAWESKIKDLESIYYGQLK